ncbi:AP-5 complex subunit zeta-1-like [Centruroides sculpturatus]|uniref:AP-5 complex subunit zeta-1-like n=1 Tax=Centruroides sculpturatus TaxID=218467 RepID=UPI000C6E7463|nr:AP-5 complex subunit zeta-1-like [Centruroides sculpturatus]
MEESKTFRDVLDNAPKELNRDYLKRIYLALRTSKHEEIVDNEAIVSSLIIMILNDSTNYLDRYLAISILQILSPQPDFLQIMQTGKLSQLLHCLPLMMVQTNNDPIVKEILKKLIKGIEDNKISKQNHWCILTVLSQLLNSENMTSDDIKSLTANLPKWLHESFSYGSSKFSSHSKKSDIIITELDGSHCQEFFTVLNCAQHYMPEHFLNIQVFSMLQHWLLAICDGTSENKYIASSLSNFSTEITACVREYCLRIVEQWQQKHTNSDIMSFQAACLTEAINILDILCFINPDLVHLVLPTFRQSYNRLCGQIVSKAHSHDIAAITAAVQFFINHSSAVMQKPDDIYPFLFCEILGKCYQDNLSAFEIVNLIKRNLPHLCYRTSVLEKYFPTIFKVLAWSPRTFLEDFEVLLPAFMSPQTSIEIFHTLLDLPCLTASLLINQRASISQELNRPRKILAIDPAVIEQFSNPSLQPMFHFILRPCSGVGDTFERIHIFHQTIVSLTKHPQVIQCAQSSISLLQEYFSIFFQSADSYLVITLFCAIIERIPVIYPVHDYPERIYEIIAKTVLQMFSHYPEIIIHGQKELVEFLSHLKNFMIAPQLFMNLVWIVGEYTSLAYSELCRPEIVTFYYENLESTVYEMISSIQTNLTFMKLINISVATLAKLASRCQDLVPRAILCLSKASQVVHNKNDRAQNIVSKRINELLAILKTPNVASIILSPSKDIYSRRWHSDPTSLPFMLRTITNMLSED